MQKLRCFLTLFICFIIGGTGIAETLNEGQLFTKDQSCQFHYLTNQNTTGWHFEIEEGVCQNKLAQGKMTLSIFDAFQRPVEQIFGYFNQGYWIGNTPLQKEVLTRTSDQATQKLTFLIGKDDFLKALFIGQMSADPKKDNQYGPFILCEPLKMLVVSEDKDLFQTQANQVSLFEKAQKFAIELCPQQETLMLFGSTKIDPKQEDIFFYADLNVQQENARILKTPDTAISSEQEALSKENISPQTEANNIDKTPLLQPERIPAFILLSKIMRQPVDAYFAVFVDQINPDNTVFLPKQHLTLKGNALKAGWQVVFGKMNAQETADGQPLSGTFQVSKSVICQEERCRDYHGDIYEF